MEMEEERSGRKKKKLIVIIILLVLILVAGGVVGFIVAMPKEEGNDIGYSSNLHADVLQLISCWVARRSLSAPFPLRQVKTSLKSTL